MSAGQPDWLEGYSLVNDDLTPFDLAVIKAQYEERMSKGLNRYEGKDKRRQRMRNHVAKDLRRGDKYRQRVVPDKRNKQEQEEVWYNEDDE